MNWLHTSPPSHRRNSIGCPNRFASIHANVGYIYNHFYAFIKSQTFITSIFIRFECVFIYCFQWSVIPFQLQYCCREWRMAEELCSKVWRMNRAGVAVAGCCRSSWKRSIDLFILFSLFTRKLCTRMEPNNRMCLNSWDFFYILLLFFFFSLLCILYVFIYRYSFFVMNLLISLMHLMSARTLNYLFEFHGFPLHTSRSPPRTIYVCSNRCSIQFEQAPGRSWNHTRAAHNTVLFSEFASMNKQFPIGGVYIWCAWDSPVFMKVIVACYQDLLEKHCVSGGWERGVSTSYLRTAFIARIGLARDPSVCTNR